MVSHFRLLIIVGIFYFIFGLFSCNDNEATPKLTNQIQLGDSIKTINSALIKDFGATSFSEIKGEENAESTLWSYDLFFTDGEFEKDEKFGGFNIVNESFVLEVALLSVGSDKFHHGEFKFFESFSKEYIEANKDEDFFSGEYRYDSDNDGDVNVDLDDIFYFTGGSVKTEGTGNDFTIDLELQLYEDQFLKGNYSGDFLYQEMN